MEYNYGIIDNKTNINGEEVWNHIPNFHNICIYIQQIVYHDSNFKNFTSTAIKAKVEFALIKNNDEHQQIALIFKTEKDFWAGYAILHNILFYHYEKDHSTIVMGSLINVI